MNAPDSLQLDLLTACARLEQIEQEGRDTPMGWFLLGRLLTCDLPRLRGHLTPETLAWQTEAMEAMK